MRNITLLYLLVLLPGFCACKKSTSTAAPPVVGTWLFTNISGIDSLSYPVPAIDSSHYSLENLQQFSTYSYSSATNTITSSTIDSGQTTPTVTTLKVTSEIWTFNADGTYSINETFINPDNQTVTSDSSGTWKYVSNSVAKNSYVLSGPVSNVFQFINPSITQSGTYLITVSGNAMTITDSLYQIYSANYVDSASIAITFIKQ